MINQDVKMGGPNVYSSDAMNIFYIIIKQLIWAVLTELLMIYFSHNL